MAPADFEFLINSTGPKIAKKDSTYTAAIPAEERLLVTLQFLAMGDSYISLQYLFKISEQEIGQIIPEVCQTIVEALKDNIELRNYLISKYNIINI
jgi:hypothetical protein